MTLPGCEEVGQGVRMQQVSMHLQIDAGSQGQHNHVRTQSRFPRWMVALIMASRSASGTSATSPKSNSASLPASGPSVT